MRYRFDPYPLLNAERGILMFYMPKCACTTACYWFFCSLGLRENVLSLPGDNLGDKVHYFRDRVFIPRSTEGPAGLPYRARTFIAMLRLRRAYKHPNIFRFAIVRNPYSRVVSSYLSAMRNVAFRCQLATEIDTTDSFSFRTFVNYLERIDLTRCDPHFRLQTTSDCWREGISLDRVVRVEYLSDELQRINRQFGFDAEVPRLYSSPKKNRSGCVEIDAAGLDYQQLVTLSRNDNELVFPPYVNFYDKTLEGKVSKIYRDDIERFGYHFSDLTSC